MEERRKQDLTAEADGIIEGRNAVIEALRAGETIDKIYLQKGERRTRPWDILPPKPGRRAWWWWRRTGGSWTP